jgi:hypothetical protein
VGESVPTTMMLGPKRFRPTPRVAVREVEAELVLLDLEEGSFFVSRGTGPRVWELLSDGCSVDEVALLVSDRYGEELDTVKADVEAFVKLLLEKQFLEEGDTRQN